MTEFTSHLNWKKNTADFVYETYDRAFQIKFEGGQTIKGSAGEEFFGQSQFANPEELLAASLGGCHLLTFLAVACKSHLTVSSYEDSPVATLEKNEAGKMAVTHIVLRPKVKFEQADVTLEKIQALHEKAHKNCMIANSVNFKVTLEPQR